GGRLTSALSENETTPTLKPSGSPSANDEAASRAAVIRFGWTSVAVIEPDRSIVSITVASCRGTASATCGRATPTISAASASSVSAGGTCRRQRGDSATTFSSRDRFVKRTTYFFRRRCTIRYAIRANATSSRPQSAIGQPKLIAASFRSAGI